MIIWYLICVCWYWLVMWYFKYPINSITTAREKEPFSLLKACTCASFHFYHSKLWLLTVRRRLTLFRIRKLFFLVLKYVCVFYSFYNVHSLCFFFCSFSLFNRTLILPLKDSFTNQIHLLRVLIVTVALC